MHNISRFSKTEIEQILSTTKRQYFVGNINLPQKLNHIEDSNLEIGITYYEKSTTEIPHYHPTQTEYGYILSGECTWIEVNSNEIHTYSEGDFFIIKPNTCYTQLANNNTKILFIKTPSINDKTTCTNCSQICKHKK